MVVVAVRAATARVILVVMAPSVGTVGAVSPPLVRSCRGDDAASMQEPSVAEPSLEELCVEEPSCFRRGRTGSSGESKLRLHW
jgi:hypothetical protein